MRDRERERERQRQRHREKQAPRREPDAGLDPGSPGSGPGLKVALNRWATGAAQPLFLKMDFRGIWVAQLVENPTLNFGSSCDLGVMGSDPQGAPCSAGNLLGTFSSTIDLPLGQPEWLSGLAPPSAQGLILETRDRVPSQAPCMEPASSSACVSASPSLSLSLSLSLCLSYE